MSSEKLYVISVVSNPAGFESRYRLYREFAKRMDQEEDVVHITVEMATGEITGRAFVDMVGPHSKPGRSHIGLCSEHILWHKENMIEIARRSLPAEAKYVAWIDADITFINPHWVRDTIAALQEYAIVQPWSKVIDLDSSGEIMTTSDSFCSMFVKNGGKTSPRKNPNSAKYGKDNGGNYTYGRFWHPGYAWAIRRDVLDAIGGVMEFPILGSADHLMALALLGKSNRITNPKLSPGYITAIRDWEDMALQVINKNIGYVPGTIAHHFHGKKKDRGYDTRTQVLIDYQFNPYTDLRKNRGGILELVLDNDRQRGLSEALIKYFYSRNEDSK
jgi:hypothetical protein